MAAVDYFLKLDGVPGECPKEGHKDSIEIESFAWGATNAGTMAYGGGGGSGKVQFQDFSFTMKCNKASPVLMLKCATGEHIKSALLTCRKAGGKQETFLKVKLTDLLVSSYQTGGSGGADVIPMDSISLNFTKVEMEYFIQGADGKVTTTGPVGFDQKQGAKV
jgi:type VI secretion system secreted protein Hcp